MPSQLQENRNWRDVPVCLPEVKVHTPQDRVDINGYPDKVKPDLNAAQLASDATQIQVAPCQLAVFQGMIDQRSRLTQDPTGLSTSFEMIGCARAIPWQGPATEICHTSHAQIFDLSGGTTMEKEYAMPNNEVMGEHLCRQVETLMLSAEAPDSPPLPFQHSKSPYEQRPVPPGFLTQQPVETPVRMEGSGQLSTGAVIDHVNDKLDTNCSISSSVFADRQWPSYHSPNRSTTPTSKMACAGATPSSKELQVKKKRGRPPKHIRLRNSVGPFPADSFQ